MEQYHMGGSAIAMWGAAVARGACGVSVGALETAGVGWLGVCWRLVFVSRTGFLG